MTAALPAAAVLDTSVLLRALLAGEGEDDRIAADRLLLAWEEGTITLSTLDLLGYEFANVLVRQQWPAAEVGRALDRLADLSLPVGRVDRGLLDAAAVVAEQSGASVYDAAFVALARRGGVPLLTADRRLVERITEHGVVLLAALA